MVLTSASFPVLGQVIFEANFETTTGDNAFGTGTNQWRVNPNAGIAGAADTATTGVWQRGNPVDTDYQPGETPSGSFALVTGASASGNDANGMPLPPTNGFNDVDGGTTTVLSPQISLPADVFGIELSFQSYASFSGTDDFFRVTVLEVGGAGETLQLINIDPTTLVFGEYERMVFDLSAFAGRTIRVFFEITDRGTGNFVEAGVDDFRVTALSPPIGGSVRFDIDGDGDLAETFSEDGPLAGVTLSLFEGDAAGAIVGNALQTVVSDRFGEFLFNGVADGRYVVTSSNLPNGTSTADSDGANDDRVVVDIAGESVEDLLFLDTTERAGIAAATAIYFLPYSEEAILTSLDTIESSAADPVTSVTSISVAFDDTQILYDHWEDNGSAGYEGFLPAPEQRLTQVWGDGNPVNGSPPGFPDDLLDAGDIIVLENTFATADAGSRPYYDGRDKILVTKYAAVTKAAWAGVSSTLFAGAWELYPTILWGRSFTLPVGEDMAVAAPGETVPDNQNDRQMFEFTGASVMSSQDDNQIRLNGTLVAVLSEGEEFTFIGGLNLGDRITSSRDSQVQLITGDIGATFESRWYTVQPDSNLSNSYIAPTSTPDTTATLVWLYNGNAADITIDIEVSKNASLPDGNPDQGTPDVPVPSIVIPPGRSISYELPNLKAARFSSRGDEIFFALAAVDADSPEADNRTHDWGYSLIPEAFLSPLAVAGFAPGDDPTLNGVPENSAPLWVTAIFPTGSDNFNLNHDADPNNDVSITLCIDYKGDGDADNLPTAGFDPASGREFDLQVTLDSLEQLVVYTDLNGDGIPDPGEDQTGTRIWVCDGSDALIALAYGQDPNTASPGSPAVDFGTTVPGIPLLDVAKGVAVENDLNGNGFPDVGDTLRYTINIANSGTAVFGTRLIEIVDNLNSFISYLPGTTALVSTGGVTAIADNSVGTPFPIDGDGPTYVFPPTLQPEENFAVTFLADVIELPANGTGSLQNNVSVSGGRNAQDIQSAAFIPIVTGTIEGTVTQDTDGDTLGDTPLDEVELILLRSDGTPVDFDGTTPGIQAYTVTTLGGFYRFPNLPAGDYIVSQSQPQGFVSLSDGDSTDGGDDAPNLSLTDNRIPVSVTASEVDDGNDFVERLQDVVTQGTISGFVQLDTNNDNLPNEAIPGVEVTLKDANGDDIDSDPNAAGVQPTVAVTGFNGGYSFSGLAPASYRVVQTQPSDLLSVSDSDGLNDNIIGEENAIVVVAGETNSGNNFLEEAFGSLSGNVSADLNGDGAGDQALAGITLTLRNEQGLDIDSDPELAGIQPTTVQTDSVGNYEFLNLAPGSYQVQESQPVNFRSISDADGGDLDLIGDQTLILVVGGENAEDNNFVEEELGSISGTVLAFTSLNTNGDEPLAFVEVTLQAPDGSDIDSDNDPSNGVQPTTALTNGLGFYLFEGVVSGNYRVVQTQPAGFSSVSDSDGLNNNLIGDETPIVLPPGGSRVGNDFVERADSSKSDNFADWSLDFAPELGSETGLADNPDGDIYPNALEYAFWLNPGQGLPGGGEFCLVKTADGTVTAEFQRRRGGLSDVTYTLEGARTLGTPTVWTEITSVAAAVTIGEPGLSFEAEKVTFQNLENASELSPGGNGVVRLRVEVDGNGNGSIEPEEIFFTQVFGWQCIDFNDYQCATFSNPFKAKPVFSGTFAETGVLSLGIDPNGNVTLDVAASAAGSDLSNVVGTNGQFYLQMTGGPLEGERFDILQGGVDQLTLINDPAIFDDSNVESLNTSNGIPSDPMFNGSSYQVIRHSTVGELFDETTIFGGEEDIDPSDSTRLLFYDSRRANPGFAILQLLGTNSSNAKWVFSDDLGAQTDQGNLRLDPSRGNWIHPKSSGNPNAPTVPAPVRQFSFGIVADYAQAVPINEGFNLLGAMWPLDQTPAGDNGRDWRVASDFDGGIDPTFATELLFWMGDDAVDDFPLPEYREGYENFMLLDGGRIQNWIDINDFFLTNQDELLILESHRAVLLKLLSGDEKVPHFYPLPNF